MLRHVRNERERDTKIDAQQKKISFLGEIQTLWK